MKPWIVYWIFLIPCFLEAQTPKLVVPVGHTKSVNAVAFSLNGQYILTGSDDRKAKLWDLSGRELQVFSGHTDYITAVAFSPDGQRILTGSLDQTAKLWDLSGKVLHSFTGHSDAVNAVAFSSDGQQVLTGSSDQTAKLWDLSGKVLQTFAGHEDIVWSVAFSPDRQHVLTGSKDQTARLWDLSGEGITSIIGHKEEVVSVAFSPDGQRVLTGSLDKTAQLWDLTGKPLIIFAGHKFGVTSVAFSPDGQQVLSGSLDKTAKRWDLSGKELTTFSGHSANINAIVFSPDGQKVLTGCLDNTAKLWDLSGRELQSYIGHSSSISSVAFSPEGRRVLVGSADKTAKLWNLTGEDLKAFLGHTAKVYAVAFSPDGQYVLTSSEDQTAKLWDLSGRELQSFGGHSSDVLSVAFSPDGQRILIGNADNTATLYTLTGKTLRSFAGHQGPVMSVSISPDGQRVLTGSYDNTAKLWDLSGRVLQTFEGHMDALWTVAFSPDGKQVLTGSSDHTAKLWDLSGKIIKTFAGHTDAVSAVAFSPDGQHILTGSWDHSAMLWDLKGNVLTSLFGHEDGISSVAFSPDGQTIITGSLDNMVKLWDLDKGRELATLIAIDAADWVLTTPSGLFDASPGAMIRLHYMMGLDVVELEQIKERYYEPGLITKVLNNSSGDLRDVQQFKDLQLYPLVEASINQNRLNIQLVKRNGGLGKLSFFVNGKEVAEDINSGRKESLSLDLKEFAKYYRTDTLNTLSLRAYNADGWLKSQALSFPYTYIAARGSGQGAGVTLGNSKPRLFAIIVGTADYSGEKLDLKYADQDAGSIAAALNAAGQQLFGSDVQLKLLSTKSNVSAEVAGSVQSEISNKANIKAAFDAFAQQAQPTDVLVLYFSGHGITYGEVEKAQFFYLTKDIGSEDLSDPEIRNKFTISSNELTDWIKSIAAQKQVLILDACNSGKIVETLSTIGQKDLNPSQVRALDRMKDRTGMFILTGSAANMVSYEASQFGQGLLTYSLLQGMSGLALTDDKRVDVMTLFQYSRDKVPELAKSINGVQIPTLAFPVGGGSFDIGIVNEKVKIPLSQAKPVFIRNNFQDEDAFEDVLGLTDALEQYFRQQTAKGVQSKLIYVDVKEYENAFSMKGRYKVTGNEVAVRVRLYKGKSPLGDELNVNGKKDDMPGLVKQILQTVMPLAK